MHSSNLANDIVQLLKRQSLTLSIAESFTGGGVANAIILVDGASSVFYEGIVCYNSMSKMERLGVDKSLLMQAGAVNGVVAKEMVCGILQTKKADIAVATTGIAGSGTDDFGTPVGRAFIACGNESDVTVQEFLFEGNRRNIIQAGIDTALHMLYEYLLTREGKL